MKNRDILTRLSRQTTSQLMLRKMECTQEISIYKSCKLGFVGLISAFTGQVLKTFMSTQPFVAIDYLCIVLTIYSVVAYFYLTHYGTQSMAEKELIIDLQALRLNRTGKRVDKTAKR